MRLDRCGDHPYETPYHSHLYRLDCAALLWVRLHPLGDEPAATAQAVGVQLPCGRVVLGGGYGFDFRAERRTAR